jgi:hypothetical protein
MVSGARISEPEAEQPPCSNGRGGAAELSLLHAGDWNLAPLAEASGDRSLAPHQARGLNGDEAEQGKAAEQFRRLIDPIVNPARYPDLHSRFACKHDLVEHIARENGLHPRTLWRKLKAWQGQQIIGLTRKIRVDKGMSRALSDAAREFILGAVLPKPGSYGELSTKDIFRMYEEERRWRSDHAGEQLVPADRARYRRYVGSDGCLLPAGQLP